MVLDWFWWIYNSHLYLGFYELSAPRLRYFYCWNYTIPSYCVFVLSFFAEAREQNFMELSIGVCFWLSPECTATPNVLSVTEVYKLVIGSGQHIITLLALHLMDHSRSCLKILLRRYYRNADHSKEEKLDANKLHLLEFTIALTQNNDIN
mmetsp:Transcript_8949/g.13009  ORF Transcript_8949/g.13009 Transcript_8949/m.13009 type:complete len:150 (+) Transcript_8949:698-1147(+)